MKTLSVEFKEELKDVVKKYVNEFERVEFRKNEAEQETVLEYCRGRVYYKNENIVYLLFDYGSGYEYDVFIKNYKKFKANGYQGYIGYYYWIEDEIKKNIVALDEIINRYDNAINEDEKESIEYELHLVFHGDYKGFYNDDSSEIYEIDDVIDIVLEEMLKDTSMIEEFVKDYYYSEYNLTNLIKLGKEHGLFADYSCDDDDD